MVVKTHHLLALVIVSTPVLVVWGCSNDVDYREPEHGSGATPPSADEPDPGQAKAEPDPEIRLNPSTSPEEPAAPATDPTAQNPPAGEPAATATQAETVCEMSACIKECMEQQSLGSCVDGACVCSGPGKPSDGDAADRLPPLDPAFDGMPEKPSMPEVDPDVAMQTPGTADAGISLIPIRPLRPMGTARPAIGTAKPAIAVDRPSTGTGMPALDAGVPNTR